MNWVLVVLVLNVPMKTDLVFDNLGNCLRAEQDMRTRWVEFYNEAAASKVGRETLHLIKGQMTTGTCIPGKK